MKKINTKSSGFVEELCDTILKQIKEIKGVDTSEREIVWEITIDEIPFKMKNSGYMWSLQSKNKDKDGSIRSTGFTWDTYENEENFVKNRLKTGLYN